MDSHALLRAAALPGRAARNPRWQPGLPLPSHSELFTPAGEASGAGMALAFVRDALEQASAQAGAVAEQREVLWVQDRQAIHLSGSPCRAGLPLALRHRLIHVAAPRPEDALFAMEEGLRCRDLAAVVGELAGNPRALDFTASRRLTLTAEKHGVPLLLVRLDAVADLSSARARWRLASLPSAPPRWNPDAPGRAAWHAELFRARFHQPGEWILRDEPDRLTAQRVQHAAQNAISAPDHGDLLQRTGAGPLAGL
ncbi:MAG: recA-like protein [Erythrobacter sp.]|nr:recA-like protein [Erythrobacter sp.]